MESEASLCELMKGVLIFVVPEAPPSTESTRIAVSVVQQVTMNRDIFMVLLRAFCAVLFIQGKLVLLFCCLWLMPT
ncbi:MAG: hypothetical protein CL912_01625 [Deltaproteobacteria bacterium]|nr:hypothetical protein [Deltaproteobacteria bacterium]